MSISDKDEDRLVEVTQDRFCVKCSCWLLIDETVGECHRRAPTRNLDCTKCCFPPTGPLQFCFEFEPLDKIEMEKRKASIKSIIEAKK